MKNKVARRIYAAAARGFQLYPLHILRQAILQVKLPLVIKWHSWELVYYPVGLKGEFLHLTMYRPRHECIVNKESTKSWAALAEDNDFLHLRELAEKSGTLTLRIHDGTHVDQAAQAATEIARYFKAVVTFTHSHSELKIHPQSQWEDIACEPTGRSVTKSNHIGF